MSEGQEYDPVVILGDSNSELDDSDDNLQEAIWPSLVKGGRQQLAACVILGTICLCT